MKYTVVWPRKVLTRLADQYLIARGQGEGQAFSNAVNRIDRLLQTSPSDRGESRSGSVRVLIETPASVMFSVIDSSREVVILRVRYVPRRHLYMPGPRPLGRSHLDMTFFFENRLIAS